MACAVIVGLAAWHPWDVGDRSAEADDAAKAVGWTSSGGGGSPNTGGSARELLLSGLEEAA